MPENLVMTSAYGGTLSGGRGKRKKLCTLGKGVPDTDVAFRFIGAKLTILGATN